MMNQRSPRTIRTAAAIALAAILALSAAGCGTSDSKDTSTPPSTADTAAAFATVSATEATSAIQDRTTLLVDVREPDEWAAGHAPQAMHVPLGDVEASLDQIKAKADGRPIAFICRSGARSAQAAQTAVDGGLKQVSSIGGGMGAWVDAGNPIVPPSGRVI